METTASVRKKFQWTPYSATCSCATSAGAEHRLRTGYDVPLTMSSRTMPNANTPSDRFAADTNLGRSAGLPVRSSRPCSVDRTSGRSNGNAATRPSE